MPSPIGRVSAGSRLPGLEIDNGSGLSRATRISALEMASVLSAAFHSRYAPEFIASLPLAGIDGTLRSRMQDTAAGSVRLKTGHIDGVSAVAGYVASAARQNLRARIARQRPALRLRRGRARARGAGRLDSGDALIAGAPCPREMWSHQRTTPQIRGRSMSQRIAVASLRSQTPKPR